MTLFDFECRSCGGQIDIIDQRNSIGKCKNCGKKVSLPRLHTQKRADFFKRANQMCLNNEFDKAEALFEEILNEDPSDPEAYWSLLLCRFGIEYVEDAKTKERKPTIHRAQATSILADEYYKNAIEHANDEQRKLYEQEAHIINDIQANILKISEKEAPFDIFICYKESDENNKRTEDSALAHHIYNELTHHGYKVFYARETLNKVMGSEYEPYIFSALNSAKVMIVLGTKKEYFEAVWVRNEWSRFLGQIKKGEDKKIIPMYKHIDAYDLPQELSNLQAMDMSRLGYDEELISYIASHFPSKNEEEQHSETTQIKKDVQKKKKKYPIVISAISLVLAIAIGLTVFTVLKQDILNDQSDNTAEASDDSEESETKPDISDSEQGLSYSENSDGTLSIIGYTGNATTVIIPGSIDGKDVTSISSEAFKNATSLTSVTIPKTVLSIGTNAFNGCTSIKTIIIPESVKTVGSEVFYGWSANQSVILQGKSADNPPDWNSTWKSMCNANIVYSLKRVNFDATTGLGNMPYDYFEMNQIANLPECSYTKEGYTFTGWALSNAEDAEIVALPGQGFDMGSDDEYTLYAVWSPNENKIIFDANTGSGEMSNAVIKTDGTENLPQNIYTKEGYAFVGWSTEIDGEVVYTDCAEYTMGVNESNTLYAVWTPNENSIIFDANGGEGSMDPLVIHTDATANLTANAFTKQGYTFVGWSDTKDGYIIYDDSAEYLMGTSSSITLYAVWGANTNKVILHANNGTTERVIANGESDSDITLPENTFTKAGYTFIGWSTTSGGEVVYNDGSSYTMSVSDTDLYAVWSPNANTLIFDANGGQGEMPSMSVKTAVSSALNLCTFTRDGYTFIGWSTDPHGSVAYSDGATYTMGTESQYTLYAVWEIGEYSITYNLNGGENNASNPAVFNMETDTITLSDPKRTGYSFKGWYTDSELTETITVIEKGTHENITIWAKWQANTYTISFDVNGGNETYEPVTITYDMLHTLPTPTQETRVFDKWILAEGSATWDNSNEILLIAKWLNEYKVTFVTNGGNAIESIYVSERLTMNLPTPTKKGLTFGGWYTDEILTTPCPEKMPGNNITVYARWNEETLIEKFNYTVSGTHVSIQKFIGDDLNIVVPTHIAGKQVNEIAKGAFENCSNLESISLPFVGAMLDGMTNTHFGYIFGAGSDSYVEAFVPSSLRTVIITGDTSIGDSAFSGCTSLTSITIPDSVTSIGYAAFYGCTNLNYTEHNNGKYLGNYDNRHVVLIDIVDTSVSSFVISENTKVIYDSAFVDCSYLASIIIPESITNIGYRAFSECSSLTNVTMPKNVLCIDDYAFSDCTGLKTITFAEGSKLEIIGHDSFYKCTSLESITIPDCVKCIGDAAFYGCTSLKTITIPNSIESIGSSAFAQCTSLEYNIHNNGRYLGNGDNLYVVLVDIVNTSITSFEIPDAVKIIYSYAFSNCKSLNSVTIPDSVMSIGCSAFAGCKSLISVTIPNSVTTIDYYAFLNCSNLTSVTVGNGVTSIGGHAFEGCHKLVEVYNLSSVKIESWGASAGYLGCYALDIYTSLDNASKLQRTDEGYIFYNDGSTVYLIGYVGSNKIELTLPSDYNGKAYSVYEYAFYDCASLTDIAIPNGVTSIGDSAFSSCTNLKSITIPSSITSIGSYAFSGCTGLTDITIPNGITSIGVSSFSGCTNLKSITIPSSVTSIGGSAFSGCTGFTSITVPDSVTSIGLGAFSGCTSLESITLPFVGLQKENTNNDHFGYIFGAGSYSNNSKYVPQSLKNVVITGGSSIASYAFHGCTHIESITLSSSLASIGKYVFYACNSLASVSFADTTTWYVTTSSSYSGGKQLSVTNASTNAKYFKDSYLSYYWYKK